MESSSEELTERQSTTLRTRIATVCSETTNESFNPWSYWSDRRRERPKMAFDDCPHLTIASRRASNATLRSQRLGHGFVNCRDAAKNKINAFGGRTIACYVGLCRHEPPFGLSRKLPSPPEGFRRRQVGNHNYRLMRRVLKASNINVALARITSAVRPFWPSHLNSENRLDSLTAMEATAIGDGSQCVGGE